MNSPSPLLSPSRERGLLATLCIVLATALPLVAGQKEGDSAPKFRTDANPDEKLPWYQIEPGVFPPEGSAHYFAGELFQADHLEREFVLRTDRTDAQRRSHWDLPVRLQMLPYGAAYYRGAPASLADIPIGTHMHALVYERNRKDKTGPMRGWHGRSSPESNFNRCLRLEDDFTYHTRRNEIWRVDEVKLDERKLAATLLRDGKPVGKPQEFDLLDSTRVWKGSGFVPLKELAKGQQAQFNITWATLYGPGRIAEAWIDKPARDLATQHQLTRHRIHVLERGLPGWVDAVDNKKRIVTITFFSNFDPALLEKIKKGPSVGVAVARHTLMTYDPVNDRKSGPVLDVKKVDTQPGSSGVQIRVKPSLLLEGYRPGRVVRVYPSGTKVIALPKEEQFFGRDE